MHLAVEEDARTRRNVLAGCARPWESAVCHQELRWGPAVDRRTVMRGKRLGRLTQGLGLWKIDHAATVLRLAPTGGADVGSILIGQHGSVTRHFKPAAQRT